MKIDLNSNMTFGWNIKTHRRITQEALKTNSCVNAIQKNMLSRFSQMPDLMEEELEGMNSAHFYDVLHENPSFGTKSNKNNALSRFLYHTEQSKHAFKMQDVELGLREAGYAAHYLQDASTPPHTEHGNFLHKIFRFPMHRNFERGKKYGASSRLEFLLNHFVPEELYFTNIKTLFHNTALFSVQPENHVCYSNKKMWPKIQQRTFNRSINATRAYFEYILQFMPKK